MSHTWRRGAPHGQAVQGQGGAHTSKGSPGMDLLGIWGNNHRGGLWQWSVVDPGVHPLNHFSAIDGTCTDSV